MKKLISVSYNNIEYFLMNSYSIDAHKSLISKINETEITLETFKKELKSLEDGEINRVAVLFEAEFGLDISRLIQSVGVKCDYMNIGYLQNYFGEQWEQPVKKLEDLGFLQFHYMFFDEDDTNQEIELSKDDYIEYSTPNQDGMCIDPLLGEECTPQEFVSRHYKYISLTSAYTDYLRNHSQLFGLKNDN